MAARTVYKVIQEYDPTNNYKVSLRKQDSKILRLLKKDEQITVPDIAKRCTKTVMKTTNGETIQDNITRALRAGKTLGLIKTVLKGGLSLSEFRKLPTISTLQNSLKKSKVEHGSRLGSTFKGYSNDLWDFNNWLSEKTIKLVKETPLTQGGYEKKLQEVKLDGLEYFLELYRDSPSHKENMKFVRICLDYLNQDSFSGLSPSTMNKKYSGIKSYFKYNLCLIEIPYSPHNKHDEILPEKKKEFKITLPELFKILTIGKPSVMEKAVILCKFHRGLDNITFTDRFNYVVWDQLVNHFGSENYQSWDLSKCPVEIALTRVKTAYFHRGFLDRDAVEAVIDYLEVQKQNKNRIMKQGEPLFLTTKGSPISDDWVLRLIPKLAKKSGVQRVVSYYKSNTKKNTKTSHELRHLLESVLIAMDCKGWVADMSIGRKISDEYEQQAEHFPNKTKKEYSRASKMLNVFSKVSANLNETEDSTSLRNEVNTLKLQNREEVQELKQRQKDLEKEMERYKVTMKFEGAVEIQRKKDIPKEVKERYNKIQRDAQLELINLSLGDPKFLESIKCTEEELVKVKEEIESGQHYNQTTRKQATK